MNPGLRQLQAFVCVYRHRSLTRAAEQMCLSQPAVSMLMRQLEEAIGMRLFDRTTRSLRPTAAAHESIAKAERILRDCEQWTNDLRDVARCKRGFIRFGATAAVASALMPPVLKAFHQRYPDIEVTMHDLAPEQLVSAVTNDEVEFSIGTPDKVSSDVELVTLIKDRLSAICTANSPLASRQLIEWRQITEYPTITVKKGTGIRTIIDDTLSRIALHLVPTYEVSYLMTALSLTVHGLGISILPSYLTRYFYSGQLRAVRLVNPVVTRNLSIMTRRGVLASPAASSFLSMLRSQQENAPEFE